MTIEPTTAPTYRRELSDGLIVRWATPDDAEHIAQLSGMVFRDSEDEPINRNMVRWVLYLMSGEYPLAPVDYGVVEDPKKEGNPIVASMCLLRQEWEYEGIPFRMGRPEIVASDPAYRNRGLIRALMEMLHARSTAEGDLLQGITGIFYFYRQFGYEYALDLGGSRTTYLSLIPQAKAGESEPYALRPATADDIPSILALYSTRQAQSIVWSRMSESYLRRQFQGWANDPERDQARSSNSNYRIIVDAVGSMRGFLACDEKRWSSGFSVYAFETFPDVNLYTLFPPVLRALKAYGEQMPTFKPDAEPFARIEFNLGLAHPLYEVLGQQFAPTSEQPYAWYIRVPDLSVFLMHIAPALTQRLARSPLVGYTGELKLDFYRGGLRMVFADGTLTHAESWQKPLYGTGTSAGFPPLVFLQLLFGRRSLEDLKYAFPDVWANSEASLLLPILFPTRPSYVIPL